MTETPRYLITTADERTWKFDRPVLFLGEWCRIYDRRHVWEKMDAIVAAPYGLGQAKKDADHARARVLEAKLFPELCSVLNEVHGTAHGERYWRIVLGHWFRRYVNVVLNRVNTLEQCLSNYLITSTNVFDNTHYVLSPTNSYEAIWAFNDDSWNNILNARIIELMGESHLIQKRINDEKDQGFTWKQSAPRSSLKRKVLVWGRERFGWLSQRFVRNSDAFIINSYLPKKEEMELQVALGQFPQVWKSQVADLNASVNHTLRTNMKRKIIESTTADRLENIARALVFKLLPVCYLEGFKELNDQVNLLPWPRKPQFIFTSNNFDTDETFKVWVAKMVVEGSKYIVGQHGNNYGTHRFMNPSIEESTADKFLTWGWTDDLPEHTPAFNFKVANLAQKKYDPLGGLLLIELCLFHRISTWDGTSEFVEYFKDQLTLADKLASGARQTLTIRLHSEFRSHRWSEISRWKALDPSLNIDTGERNIRDLIAQSRLVVHSYDSSGIFETLAQNIPTMAFWQNGFEHLRDSAKPYYQLLVDAGIVHLSAESLARKVNEVWDDVDGWWLKESVQQPRKTFCERYARFSKNPVRDLKKILMDSV